MQGPAEAAFPGNNGLIAFASNRSIASGDPLPSDSEIFTAQLVGDLTQLTKNSTSDNDPAFSADGTKIAFSSNRDGNEEIYVMDTDPATDDATNLTKSSAAADSEPAFSPDGKRIAFTSFRNGNTDVYVIDSDGTDLKRLTKNSAYDAEPAWSPDGTRIAFTTDRNVNNEIFVMKPRPEGKKNRPKNLTKSLGDDERPNWSADGKQIVFATNRGVGGTYDIYKMNADGTGATHLTEHQSSFDYSPAWSPDGNFIIFQRNVSGNTDLWAMNADGSSLFNLTNDPATDEEPDWGRQPT